MTQIARLVGYKSLPTPFGEVAAATLGCSHADSHRREGVAI